MFRDEGGTWRHAVTLPDEISGPIGRAVLDELVNRGLATRTGIQKTILCDISAAPGQLES